MKITAGEWDRSEEPVYFIAANVGSLYGASTNHRHILAAVNEMMTQQSIDTVAGMAANGNSVLIDSGVYWLSTQHAKAHGITMNEALALAPDDIDGFEDLLTCYLNVIAQFGSKCWGYIEIDQGGRDNKIKTRRKLEKRGLRPIPVYHPLNDGWDYFDELASEYDRICFGNVVLADPATRKRLMATAWERKRKYPHLWIHALGLCPSDMTNAWPVNSCDSSSWLTAVRWGFHSATVATKCVWRIGPEFIGSGAKGDGLDKALLFCGYDSALVARNMQTMTAENERVLGCNVNALL